MIRTVVRLRLLGWMRRPGTYLLAAALPVVQSVFLLMYLSFVSNPGPISANGRRYMFRVLVFTGVAMVAVLVPAQACGALLRSSEDDEVARLASTGADSDTIFTGALLAELLRGLLLVWVALPVMLYAALLLRPRHAPLLLLLPHFAACLAVVCGVLPSILAPNRYASGALAYSAMISALLSVVMVARRLGERPMVTALLALCAFTLCGTWLGLRMLRWRGLHYR